MDGHHGPHHPTATPWHYLQNLIQQQPQQSQQPQQQAKNYISRPFEDSRRPEEPRSPVQRPQEQPDTSQSQVGGLSLPRPQQDNEKMVMLFLKDLEEGKKVQSSSSSMLPQHKSQTPLGEPSFPRVQLEEQDRRNRPTPPAKPDISFASPNPVTPAWTSGGGMSTAQGINQNGNTSTMTSGVTVTTGLTDVCPPSTERSGSASEPGRFQGQAAPLECGSFDGANLLDRVDFASSSVNQLDLGMSDDSEPFIDQLESALASDSSLQTAPTQTSPESMELAEDSSRPDSPGRVEEADSVPVEEGDSAPVGEGDSAPMEEADPAPVEEGDSVPVEEADSVPMEEADSASMEETDPAPVEGDSVPVEEADSVPMEEANSASMEEADPAQMEKAAIAPSQSQSLALPLTKQNTPTGASQSIPEATTLPRGPPGGEQATSSSMKSSPTQGTSDELPSPSTLSKQGASKDTCKPTNTSDSESSHSDSNNQPERQKAPQHKLLKQNSPSIQPQPDTPTQSKTPTSGEASPKLEPLHKETDTTSQQVANQVRPSTALQPQMEISNTRTTHKEPVLIPTVSALVPEVLLHIPDDPDSPASMGADRLDTAGSSSDEVEVERVIDRKNATNFFEENIVPPEQKDLKVMCYVCDTNVEPALFKHHLFFGLIRCHFCNRKLMGCRLLQNDLNNSKNKMCSPSPTKTHSYRKWASDPIEQLSYYIRKEVVIKRFCAGKKGPPPVPEIVAEIKVYIGKLSSLELWSPWNYAFQKCYKYIQERNKAESGPLQRLQPPSITQQQSREDRTKASSRSNSPAVNESSQYLALIPLNKNVPTSQSVPVTPSVPTIQSGQSVLTSQSVPPNQAVTAILLKRVPKTAVTAQGSSVNQPTGSQSVPTTTALPALYLQTLPASNSVPVTQSAQHTTRPILPAVQAGQDASANPSLPVKILPKSSLSESVTESAAVGQSESVKTPTIATQSIMASKTAPVGQADAATKPEESVSAIQSEITSQSEAISQSEVASQPAAISQSEVTRQPETVNQSKIAGQSEDASQSETAEQERPSSPSVVFIASIGPTASQGANQQAVGRSIAGTTLIRPRGARPTTQGKKFIRGGDSETGKTDNYLMVKYPTEPCPDMCPTCYTRFDPQRMTLQCSSFLITVQCEVCKLTLFLAQDPPPRPKKRRKV